MTSANNFNYPISSNSFCGNYMWKNGNFMMQWKKYLLSFEYKVHKQSIHKSNQSRKDLLEFQKLSSNKVIW